MSVPADLVAWLVAADRHAGFRVDLITVSPKGYPALRWTSADRKVMTLDGRVFRPGPGIDRGKIRLAAGLQVSEMDLGLEVDDTVMVGPLRALTFAQRGLFDGAAVTLEWAYFDTARVFKGSHQRFSGTAGPAELEAGRIDLLVRSDISKLNVAIPREVYQPQCLNQLFDARCGLDADAWAVAGAVTAVPAGRAGFLQFVASGLGQQGGHFDLGAVEFWSGDNESVVRTVKAHAAGGVITLAQPLPVVPAVGDTFVVIPGCNRSQARCLGTFNNRRRFRGTPYVPAAETVA